MAPSLHMAVTCSSCRGRGKQLRRKFYAYRNACAEGQLPLDDALFESPMLTCLCHGYRYDLRHQGKCMEKPALRLASLAVIVEDEKVKVAL